MKKLQTPQIFLVLFTIFVLTSCKKQPSFIEGTIRGTVIDQVTKLPVPDARIFFRHRDICPFDELEECWTVLDSTSYITDSLGRFTISYHIETEYKPSNPHRLSAKPRKEGYFNLRVDDIGAFGPGRDTITVSLFPMTYLRVRILDVNPGPDRKYDGIRMWHTIYVPIDSVVQNPLDTTLIIIADPFMYNQEYLPLTWNLFYLDHPEILGPRINIPNVQCPPHDTCDVEIRF
jgi:hypothetical protein